MKGKRKLFVGILAFMLIGILWSFPTLAYTAATPTGLQQNDSSENSVKFSWNFGGLNKTYQYRISTDNKTWRSPVDNSTVCFVTVRGLGAGSLYYVQVRAYENSSVSTTGYSAWSPSLAVITAPEGVPAARVKQTGASNRSVTLSWQAVSGATDYDIYYGVGMNQTVAATTKKTSVVLNGLEPGERHVYEIVPKKSIDGYTATANRIRFDTTFYAKTTSDRQCVNIYGVYPTINKFGVKWTTPNTCDGYEVLLYNYSGKLVSRKVLSHLYDNECFNNIKYTSFYVVKVRSFVNTASGRMYGKAASVTFANQIKPSVKTSGKGIKIRWSKVKGATNYTVYVAASKKGKYKKAATTKSTSCTIKKYGKKSLRKGKTYYFYVVSNRKVKGKTYKSSTPDRYPATVKK